MCMDCMGGARIFYNFTLLSFGSNIELTATEKVLVHWGKKSIKSLGGGGGGGSWNS